MSKLFAVEHQIDDYLTDCDREQAYEEAIENMMDILVAEVSPGCSDAELRALAEASIDSDYF